MEQSQITQKGNIKTLCPNPNGFNQLKMDKKNKSQQIICITIDDDQPDSIIGDRNDIRHSNSFLKKSNDKLDDDYSESFEPNSSQDHQQMIDLNNNVRHEIKYFASELEKNSITNLTKVVKERNILIQKNKQEIENKHKELTQLRIEVCQLKEINEKQKLNHLKEKIDLQLQYDKKNDEQNKEILRFKKLIQYGIPIENEFMEPKPKKKLRRNIINPK